MVKFELKRLTLVRLHLHDACATESWKMGSSLYERIPQEAARGHVFNLLTQTLNGITPGITWLLTGISLHASARQ